MKIAVVRKIAAVACAAVLAALFPFALGAPVTAQGTATHNVILFVPDGLRASMVDAQTAPEMYALEHAGVTFSNPHSIFPTFTTANASAMATGHKLGDTGDFSNTIFSGYPLPPVGLSRTPFLENDPVLLDIDEHFDGNYLNEETILAAAHAAGYGTASVGKLGPVAIFDAGDKNGTQAIVIDDSTGNVNASGTSIAWPLPQDVKDALAAATGGNAAPKRGSDPGQNGNPGDATHTGATVANVVQQNWFVDAATKVVLPRLKAAGKPFVLVFWSRDPDGTQHNQGDSPGKLVPGINGPTSLASIKNADDDLHALRQALGESGLAATTDVIVVADHGFSTISKESATSPSAKYDLTGVAQGQLPPGFLALDVGVALGLPVSDPDNNDAVVHPDLEHKYPSRGNGLIGSDISKPDAIVASNGGSDLIYLPQGNAGGVGDKIVAFLLKQDYVSGIFVDPAIWAQPPAGTLSLAAIDLAGTAKTPRPAIAVSFRSWSTGCQNALRCTAEIADTTLQQGQGMHGSFSRADTANFMAAIGPDFKRAFVDPAPVSNADIGVTIARIMHLTGVGGNGTLLGRAITEARPNGVTPAVTRGASQSASASGLVTTIRWQRAGGKTYLDAAGFPGRTVGL